MNALVPLSNSSAQLSSSASVPKDHEPTNCWNTSAPLHAQNRLPPQQLATLYSVYLVASILGILGSVFVAWKTKTSAVAETPCSWSAIFNHVIFWLSVSDLGTALVFLTDYILPMHIEVDGCRSTTCSVVRTRPKL